MPTARGQTWGVTISAAILQNELKSRLPAAFVAQFPQGVEIAYAAIPLVRGLEEPTRTQVRIAFAESMATVWKALAGFSGAGFLTLLLLQEVPMQTHTDATYGLREGAAAADADARDDGESGSVALKEPRAVYERPVDFAQ